MRIPVPFLPVLFAGIILLSPIPLRAQMPLWAFNVGSTSDDIGYQCKVAPNGNVYLAGKFQGTMDLDPGPGVHNVTSNGLDDMFLACYTSTGMFLWGFSMGSTSYDGIQWMEVDKSSNVYVGGWFRGYPTLDFDPLVPGTHLLTDAGECCGSPPWDGDGFIAKYSPTGTFLWAQDLGAETVYDHSSGIATDSSNNVYIVGEFTGTMVLSPSITLNTTVGGKCYIIKYDSLGHIIWVDNFGLPGYAADDTQPWSIKATYHGVYVCGVLQGTSFFNPAGGAWLTATGYYCGFIAKYDTAGHYVFAKAILGAGSNNQAYDLVIDSLENMYVTGFTNSASIVLDATVPATSTFTCPGGGGNYDMWVAKYDKTGTFKWGEVLGGPGDDLGYQLDIIGNYIYYTGSFSNTVDFDPSPSVANLTSHGGSDIYITKNDLNGNYICGFNVGSSTDDVGWGFSHDTAGNLYACGQFTGSAVDFDPGTGTTALTSNGGSDAYLVKYSWVGGGIAGYIVGDTICSGQTAHLTLMITSGSSGPFTITISDGTSTYTVTGVTNGTPFTLPVSPTATTTYSITSISYPGMNICTAPSGAAFGTAIVLVNPAPNATITTTQVSCNVITFSIPGTDGNTYFWKFGDGDTATINPVTHTYTATGTYTVVVTVTNMYGCTAIDSTTVHITAPPIVNLGPDTTLCTNNSLYPLASSNTYSSSAAYLWSTGGTASTINATTSGTYWLTVTDNGCSGSDTVKVKFKPQPEVWIGNDTTICPGVSLQLGAAEPAGAQYQWSTGSTDSSVSISAAGTYSLTVTVGGCQAAASITISQGAADSISLGPDTSLCIGDWLTLTVNASTAIWNTNQHGSSIKVDFPGTYWVTVPEQCGEVSDTIKVDFHICDIGFPSAFTPNGDGRNDVIGVVGTLKYYRDFSLSIYNRWGQRVFYTEDIYEGWDGIFNGVKQDLGTYFYMIFYSLEGKKHMMKGDFQLIR